MVSASYTANYSVCFQSPSKSVAFCSKIPDLVVAIIFSVYRNYFFFSCEFVYCSYEVFVWLTALTCGGHTKN